MLKYINNVMLKLLVSFISLPLLLWASGNYPQRSLLKESLSLTTLVAFSLAISLFYLARPNHLLIAKVKASKLITLHKVTGYSVVVVLLLHPLALVVPRFFEAGITPPEAFMTIITTFTSRGIVVGIIAWSLMLLLATTSLLRKKLPLTFKNWKAIHGTLALLCICCAAYHVIDLGRHVNLTMSATFVLLSLGGITMLLRSYTSPEKKVGKHGSTGE